MQTSTLVRNICLIVGLHMLLLSGASFSEELYDYQSFHDKATPVPSFGSLVVLFSEEGYYTAEQQYEAARGLSARSSRPTEENYVMAMRLYDSAARKLHAYSMHNLAIFFTRDIFEPDFQASTAWYEHAAKLGFAGSQNNFGDAIEKGYAPGKTKSDAIYWYTKAAMQGEPTAYLSLGACFLDGVGVEQNSVEAAYWLELAVANLPPGLNLEMARSALSKAQVSLQSDEQVEVEFRVETYKPLKQTGALLQDKSSVN